VTLPSPPYDIAAWRARIPILEHAIPMNNCSQAPQTDATQAAVDAYLRSWAREGMDWDAWMAEVERARQSFALVPGPRDVQRVFALTATRGLFDWRSPAMSRSPS